MPSKPQAGDRYVYTGEEPIGVDAGALLPGTVVTLRNVGTEDEPSAVVKADEPGAHDDRSDAVVVVWEAPSIVIGDDGKMKAGVTERAMSIPLTSYEVNTTVLDEAGRPVKATLVAFRDAFEKAEA